MSKSCPISVHRIDAHVVRLIALQVLIVGSLLLLTEDILFSFLLLFDFLTRSLKIKQLSPFANIANIIINNLHIKPNLCDEAPKRFSVHFGLVIIGFLTLFLISGYTEIATVLIVALLFCAFLEATLEYCVGCKIYYYIKRIFPKL